MSFHKYQKAQPGFSKPFILTTDALEHFLGEILSQKDDHNNEFMVYAYSKTMDNAQKNYSVTDKELLAVVKSMENFRRYLIGKEFVLRTDHGAIKYINEAKYTNT
jgi:hypothetical protein